MTNEMFTIFSLQHFIVIVLGIVSVILTLILSDINKIFFPKFLSFLILLLKISELIYKHKKLGLPITNILPLHLCNITLFLATLCIIFNIKWLTHICYFFSPGALFAILTPDQMEKLPNFVGISFFITHFYILFVPLFFIFVVKYRPTLLGILISFIFLNICVVSIYIINKYLGTNYMYINYKPDFKSALDYLGKWPFYIIVEETIFIILAFILYLPFRRGKNYNKKRKILY